ncbi:DUF1611 domain-containing protein [Phyllobacterium salinisoli]|uniref:DUF1611 domain-containing protein n=1 Tax=Phyllobacterium salinisoli TaxID=1899321 RepID=UPI00135BB4DA|nr:DUF1611 domain-containing protein [Phyllobacterium salinisoli]
MITTDILDQLQHRAAKWAFTTRRVNHADVTGLSTAFADAVAGDLLVGRIAGIGQHKNIQLASGRGSENYIDDLVVMCVGDRYASDQFEGHAIIDADGCDMIAGGGIVGRMVRAHETMNKPTRISPIGLLTNAADEVINIAAYGLPCRAMPRNIDILAVFGTSMNAGKTTAAASLAHGLRRAGYAVAGIKTTGTGAFGDFNAFGDAGVPVTDFVDAGMPTTYRMPLNRITRGFHTLVAHAAEAGAKIMVVEFADGVFQSEVRALLADPDVHNHFAGILFAAGDSAGAVGGVSVLRAMGFEPFALSGLITRAPLAAAEASEALSVPVLARNQLRDPQQIIPLLRPMLGLPSRSGHTVPIAAE